jgi:hypothetical protein
MRFLSQLFRTTPAPDEWAIIATRISSGFQEAKKRWFNECVVAVDLGLFADKQAVVDPGAIADDNATVKVVNTELCGAGAVAITGFQICFASSFIAMNGYVPKDSTNAFLDLLCGRVFGVEPGELLKSIRRYTADNDPSTQRFKLGVDVARYITDQEPSMILSLHVSSLAEKLTTLTGVVIANEFGDAARVRKLSRQITSLDAQLWPNY